MGAQNKSAVMGPPWGTCIGILRRSSALHSRAYVFPASILAALLLLCLGSLVLSPSESRSARWLAQGRERFLLSLNRSTTDVLYAADQTELLPHKAAADKQRMAVPKAALPLPRVVVSLSSFAGRLMKLNETLPSLLEQSLPPAKIYLAVPSAVERINVSQQSAAIPAFLTALEKSSKGHFKILRTKDYGPSTKLLPALQQETDPKTIIITVDDDVYYHPDTILALVSALTFSPQTSKLRYAPCWYCEEWGLFGKAIRKESEGVCRGWLGAYAGAAYYRDYFNEAVFDYVGAPEGCRLHDDVWISGNLYRRGIRPYVMQPGFWSAIWHASYTNLSIHSVKNTEKGYRDPCVKYFDWFKHLKVENIFSRHFGA